MASSLFFELSMIIVIAAITTGIIRLLRQPAIMGYLLTGILVSSYVFNIVESTDTISLFSEIGIALLLFIVGLNLTPKVIKEVGPVALIAGLGQIAITFTAGFVITKLLGFTSISALYVAIALTFSSTIVIMKLLSDKRDLETLYGKISIGILLLQDLIAILALIVISSISNNIGISELATQTIITGSIIVVLLVLISKYILPHLAKFFAKSQEYLFLFSIAWGFGLSILFQFLNLSIEIGALIAGVTLSVSPYSHEISAKMRPLRDFFMILFFVLLGSQLAFDEINKILIPALILSLFIFIIKPLTILAFMGLTGHKKRNGFLVGLTLAQISEFSFIVIALGVKSGHIQNDIVSLITLTGLITIAGSSYLILYAEKIYPYFSDVLSIFERKQPKKIKDSTKKYNIILFGYNRVGYDFVKTFQKLKKKFLVVDYNPDVISRLTDRNMECIYGDVDDAEFLDELNLDKIKMAISTIPHYETNVLLIEKIRKVNRKAIIIVVSHHIDEAYGLYNKGVTYVLMPHFLGGKYMSNIIDRYGFDLDKFSKERSKQIKHLKERKEAGHEHPKTESVKY